MIKRIKDINVNYISYGNDGGREIVLLHGWGQNIEMMRPIGDSMCKNYHVTIVDLPGFGESEDLKKVWTLYDYVDCIHQLLTELNITKPILIGHSFGGKISLIYASMYEVSQMVLFGSPFQKDIQELSRKTKLLKQLKKVPGLNKLENVVKKHVGSTDYKNASPILREVMVGHVNLDITDIVKTISCPTLLVWGTMDEAVSIESARKLESLIPNAGLVTYDGCTHYAYLERLGQTVRVVRTFLESEEK